MSTAQRTADMLVNRVVVGDWVQYAREAAREDSAHAPYYYVLRVDGTQADVQGFYRQRPAFPTMVTIAAVTIVRPPTWGWRALYKLQAGERRRTAREAMSAKSGATAGMLTALFAPGDWFRGKLLPLHRPTSHRW